MMRLSALPHPGIVLAIFFIAAAMLLLRIPSYAQSDEDERLIIVNPRPILTSDQAPNFKMQSSETSRDKKTGEDFVAEIWCKPGVGSDDASFIKITLYPVKNQAEALSGAKAVFGATTEANQYKAVGKPTPGSYSGRPIGDFCWAYTVSSKGSRGPVNQSSSLVVVYRNYLFKVLFSGPQVDDAYTETVAAAIANRLNSWSRP